MFLLVKHNFFYEIGWLSQMISLIKKSEFFKVGLKISKGGCPRTGCLVNHSLSNTLKLFMIF